MINKILLITFGLVLSSCVVKNYETPPAKPEDGATIHWKDGSKTQIKPPVIETRP